MAHALITEEPFELFGVGEVPVVGKRKAVRRVHVERLRLGARGGPCGGVANVPDADVALETEHVSLEEHVRDEAVRFSEAKVAVHVGQDACSILSAVLKHGKSVIQELVDVCTLLANNTNDAAHAFPSSQPIRGCFLSLR